VHERVVDVPVEAHAGVELDVYGVTLEAGLQALGVPSATTRPRSTMCQDKQRGI
jgi:hypothetical protein